MTGFANKPIGKAWAETYIRAAFASELTGMATTPTARANAAAATAMEVSSIAAQEPTVALRAGAWFARMLAGWSPHGDDDTLQARMWTAEARRAAIWAASQPPGSDGYDAMLAAEELKLLQLVGLVERSTADGFADQESLRSFAARWCTDQPSLWRAVEQLVQLAVHVAGHTPGLLFGLAHPCMRGNENDDTKGAGDE